MNVHMNLLSTGDFNEHWVIFPPKGALPYGAYVVNPDGRVLVVATEGLLVYPEYNDQMIAGIPRVTLPQIEDRDVSLWGPSGKDFLPDWEPPAATRSRTYPVRVTAPDTGDHHYLH